jgi:hypothetical protein
MVKNEKQHIEKTRTKQGCPAVRPDPHKIGHSDGGSCDSQSNALRGRPDGLFLGHRAAANALQL